MEKHWEASLLFYGAFLLIFIERKLVFVYWSRCLCWKKGGISVEWKEKSLKIEKTIRDGVFRLYG